MYKSRLLTMLPHVKKYSFFPILINLSTRLLQFVKILNRLPVAMDSMNNKKNAAARRLNLMSSLRLIGCLGNIKIFSSHISYTPQGLDLYISRKQRVVVNVRPLPSGKLKNQFLLFFFNSYPRSLARRMK